MTQKSLIAVNSENQTLGTIPHDIAHAGRGILHRAISAFLFTRTGEVLLQKRSSTKLLWPDYWSNSCCTHPAPGETALQAATRRVKEELGCSSTLTPLFEFQYQAQYTSQQAEHELCSVFWGTIEDELQPDPHEVADLRMIPPAALSKEIWCPDTRHTPWCILEWLRIERHYLPNILEAL